MTNYGWLWTLVHSIYSRAKFLIFSIAALIILVVAYYFSPIFNQFLGNSRRLFALIMIVGLVILLLDGIWLVTYKRHLSVLDKTNKTLPENCPFCSRDLETERIDRSLLFGFPGARLELSCSYCGTHLVSDYPFRYWTFTKIDAVLNSTFAWLYQGVSLNREDLNLVLNKQHAETAKVKLRASGNPDLEQVWFDKPTARAITRLRTGPLEEIISGNMSALSGMNPDILRTPPEVNTAFFKRPSDLDLHKEEKVILYVAPVRLAVPNRAKSENSENGFRTKDTGFFFVSNQRAGFRGKKHRTNFPINTIDDLDHRADRIVILPRRRKNPDYYLDLDGELVYCVLLGLINTNEIS